LRSVAAGGAAAARELAQIPAESARHRPSPPTEGLVLDVGGGQSPHPRADVVVDKYVVDDFERAGTLALDLSKPLVVADGHCLPFADQTFTYAIAMHVLEHATDPVRFAGELARVSGAGFVQVPTLESELTFGWPYHPWTIDRDGETLVFTPKGERNAPLGALFHESFSTSALFRLWWSAHRSQWHHSLEWRDELRVEVRGESRADATASFELERTIETLRRLGSAAAPTPLPPAVRSALRCPVDAGELVARAGSTTCDICGRLYPVIGEVPVLIDIAAA
jgi:SAM-dependent methyltransferase